MIKSTRILSLFTILAIAACVAPPPGQPAPPLSFGMTDDFTTDTQNWREGNQSNTPPVQVAGGGPGGAGDAYLENASNGRQEPGGKMIMLNRSQWQGRYPDGAVVRAEVRNLGTTPLSLRLAVESGSTRYASSDAVELAPGGDWQTATFPLDEASMARIDGFGSLRQVLDQVTEVRILSADQPQWTGSRIEGLLGIDNIRLERAP